MSVPIMATTSAVTETSGMRTGIPVTEYRATAIVMECFGSGSPAALFSPSK